MKEHVGTTPVDYVKSTAKNFADRETVGGLLLILATLVAVAIMNSSWAEAYEHFWEEKYVIASQEFGINRSLHHWINDGLMVIFFFVVGLELKREFLVGELADLKNATVPVMAALGGMAVPALIYVFFNAGGEHSNGWGVPMATDIAYTLGIIALLGKRVPPALKIFLTALAIVDDIGAILVIALFYSSDISWISLGIGGGVMVVLFALNYLGVRNIAIYLILGVVLWVAFLMSGVHATIAGVLLALAIPVKVKMGTKTFKKKTEEKLDELTNTDLDHKSALKDKKQLDIVHEIRDYTIATRSPLLRLENSLSGFNAFFIIPLFALSNAGVAFEPGWTDVFTSDTGHGIMIGLVLGKLVGVFFFSWLAIKLGLGQLPKGSNWGALAGTAMLAGIGFTMSLFITNLAFEDGEVIDVAKISILIASFLAAILGLIILSLSLKKNKNEENV
ncbi:Na+/H+ antiporter NhaA [Fulvivirga maritima]|uniref:Na+/H+ antiporter NhaA n=1 Tax=Fulvivirga maritima TaxID=2904247 RepID=UPI001F32AF64|nr:Na+/H+ antiporter NhaA [Fulvivirga maritima]UII25026.1 Na+/H+ antiporter NhaA [Fulvivirga maritima]